MIAEDIEYGESTDERSGEGAFAAWEIVPVTTSFLIAPWLMVGFKYFE